MNEKNTTVTIYLPNGDEPMYTTDTENKDPESELVNEIICEAGEVRIAYAEGDKMVEKSYVGMPYRLKTW